ncbi:acetolactate synthase large subunit [Pontitalea aquivivens]|uniref:acetolactate synthase large subunit n=1 Tax=Pontitalea aquivivens TaxID=3388663 RepID=UPI003970E930
MTERTFSGAEALVETLIHGAVSTCFANPGTSEMHFVAALDRSPGIRCVLGLQENVVTGMADGYFRVARRPAATLLHCGPGLSNGLANLHNARRAGAGIVNIVGDHALAHVPYDSPLTSDVVALAKTCSHWCGLPASPEDLGEYAARAVQVARQSYGKIATLVLPADVSWGLGASPGSLGLIERPEPVTPFQIERAVSALRGPGRSLLLLGTPAVGPDAHMLLAGLQELGVDLMLSSLVSVLPVGRGRLPLPRVPYGVEDALDSLEPYDHVILVNCPPPTAFFLYPGRPSLLSRADAEIIELSRPDQDALAALAGVLVALGGTPCAPPEVVQDIPAIDHRGPIDADGFAEVVCALLPRDAIVCDEAITLGSGFPARLANVNPCDWLSMVGGAIGGGLPMATGAAIGAADVGQGHRRVVSIQADGSAAYTLQALWTQARENLPCTTLLLNNRKYAILQGEYTKVGATPGQTAFDMLSLDRPGVDWVKVAESFGVNATAVTTLEGLHDALTRALSLDGPCLIDVQFAESDGMLADQSVAN